MKRRGGSDLVGGLTFFSAFSVRGAVLALVLRQQNTNISDLVDGASIARIEFRRLPFW
jgi:hypothetical protein